MAEKSKTKRVCVLYQPRLYNDILQQLLRSLKMVKVVEVPRSLSDLSSSQQSKMWDIDVILLSLNTLTRREISHLTRSFSDVKLIAFSPNGAHGMVRLPHQTEWVKYIPFGLRDLLVEIFS